MPHHKTGDGKMSKGLVHVYFGDGKGKTTAAAGLAVRAAGCGKKVLVVQLLKGRPSGEVSVLQSLPGVAVASTASIGLDPDFIEAAGFAWLARETLAGRPGNLPAVTGARGPRVLGVIHPA